MKKVSAYLLTLLLLPLFAAEVPPSAPPPPGPPPAQGAGPDRHAGPPSGEKPPRKEEPPAEKNSGRDAEASAKYEEGHNAYTHGAYHEAAGIFDEVIFLAGNPTIKANAMLAQTASWRMSGYYFKEFQNIEALLDKYSDFVDFEAMLDREFEIGQLFFKGRREPLYWTFRWIPWLTDKDHTEEILKKALARAPFHKRSAEARLTLAMVYDEEQDIHKSLEQLRLLLRDQPKAKEAKLAALALGNGLTELARRSDGDGRYSREATEVLEKYCRENPESQEAGWAKRQLLKTADIQAERLQQMAEFYRKSGRSEAARRYQAQLLRDYPDSLSAEKAEQQLAEQDPSFVPGNFPLTPESRYPQLSAYRIPDEAEQVLYSPMDERHHFLQPVPDLHPQVEEEKK